MSGRLIILVTSVAAQAFAAPPPADDAVTLLAKAKEARKEKSYKAAFALLERCLAIAPDDPDCVVALASTHAGRGTEENNDADARKAKQLYERFLQVARSDDKRILRVREILGYDPNGPPIVVTQPPSRPRPAAKPMAGERVTIIVGGTHRISVPSFERVDIAQPSIATVELESPGVLLLTALKAGNTTLTWSTQDRQTWAIPVTVKAK